MSAEKRNFVDEFESPDFYALDDLLTDEHKLIRSSVRDFVKKEITPFIEGWAEKNHFPEEIVKKFGEVGAFGPTVPAEYGGGGLGLYLLWTHHAGSRKRRFRDEINGLCSRLFSDVSHLCLRI